VIKMQIRPNNPVTETIAEISISDPNIYISFLETDDNFRDLVKDQGFRWGGFDVGWKRKCTKFTGSPLDRATEISILLLKAGFMISISDNTLKEKILKKEYEPEHKRWIAKRAGGKYNDWFVLSWEYGNDKIYKASRAVAGSRWNKPYVVIPPYQFEAILDLVDHYNFRLSDGAKELIEQARKTKEEALIVDMSEIEEPAITEQPKKEEYGICASLRDDD